MLVRSLRAITICSLSNSLRSTAFPITRKIKCKNDCLPSPAAVKYHSHLTTCPPHHPDEFIEKCGDGHNVLARQYFNANSSLFECIVRAAMPSGKVLALEPEGPKFKPDSTKDLPRKWAWC
ncbi:hypothetical protein AVEN_137035-1 [Araneus ventricosus]|uniref:Uncharacterized protein n=1 Tax=Araneus ventricosus TaxID=182803 RepID=A0A4Y2PAI3_ARAVE|nr:hypothetical protein AVEN_137035-1 [Araneus ventricosus]